MSDQFIGRIVSIDYKEIIVETIENIGDYVCTDDGIRFVGELGSYIIIEDVDRRIIAEIVAVIEKDVTANIEHSKAKNDRFFKISPVGEIVNNLFNFGITKMPPMFSEVKLISEKDLQVMMNVANSEINVINGFTKLAALPIGTSVLFPDYDVKVRLNEFFGFHFAVLGNTGSGKSNTIAYIIQKIFSKSNYSACGANFIIFDSNGEYQKAFENISYNNTDINIKNLSTDDDDDHKFIMPVWALNVDDWSILLHASEKTQIPIINRALEIIKIFSNNDDSEESNKVKDHIVANVALTIMLGPDSSTSKSDKITSLIKKYHTSNFSLNTKITIQNNEEGKKSIQEMKISEVIQVVYGKMVAPASFMDYCESHINPNIKTGCQNTGKPVIYSLLEFKEAIDYAILYEGSITSNKIFEYAATLVARIQHLIESDHGKYLSKTSFTSFSEYIGDILGDNQILNIDISNLDDTSADIVTKVFSKMLFDYSRKFSPRNSKQINLIIEEAHRFIKENEDYGVLGYNIFERIAKEGRKYGLHMGISSQRPGELSKTVVSQCSNFIIHRLQNPDDLRFISNMVPYVNKSMIDRMSYLPRGHALVFGTAINLPMLTSFGKADPSPNSGNSDITENWYILRPQT